MLCLCLETAEGRGPTKKLAPGPWAARGASVGSLVPDHIFKSISKRMFKTLLSTREVWASNRGSVKSDTVSATARHRCNASTEQRHPGAKPRRWAPSLVSCHTLIRCKNGSSMKNWFVFSRGKKFNDAARAQLVENLAGPH